MDDAGTTTFGVTRGTSTTTYKSVTSLSMMPNPMPSSCIRAAIDRSALLGSSHPEG